MLVRVKPEKIKILATESTEKHGKKKPYIKYFRVLPWIPWPLKKVWHLD
jgi:hypothetical protein